MISSPLAFTKELLIVEGYLLIREIRGLELFRFLHLLGWESSFEVGINYSSLWVLSLNFSILRCWGWFGNFVKVWDFCVNLQKLGF